VVWKKNFGGGYYDFYNSVMTVSDGIVAVGEAYVDGNNDWAGFAGKGEKDAIVVKYEKFIPVANIANISDTMTAQYVLHEKKFNR
jgi:hypothetical protein